MFPINFLVVKNMKKMIMIASLVLSVTACESLYEANDDGIPRIRSQRDVEAYNATVSLKVKNWFVRESGSLVPISDSGFV